MHSKSQSSEPKFNFLRVDAIDLQPAHFVRNGSVAAHFWKLTLERFYVSVNFPNHCELSWTSSPEISVNGQVSCVSPFNLEGQLLKSAKGSILRFPNLHEVHVPQGFLFLQLVKLKS